jgi:hypothetical integral membrane protein (TIGR02206 family)
MFPYYFLYEDQIPAGSGFSLFGPTHLFWLFLIALSAWFIIQRFLKMNVRKKAGTEKCIVILLLFLDLHKDFILFVSGRFSPQELPFDMCELAVYISLFHAFTHSRMTGELLYCLCMPGALAALIFPNWNSYPQINFINLTSFFMHALLVIYPLMLLISRKLIPSIRFYPLVWVFLFFAVPFVRLLNRIYGTNFFFLNIPSKDSPLVFIYNLFGADYYLLGYACLVISINLLMYLPYLRKKRNR